MNASVYTKNGRDGFSLLDVAEIESIIEGFRKALCREGIIHPKDIGFPFIYHNQHILACLGAQNKVSLSEVGKQLYRWGVENGPRAYAFQAIEAACRKLYGDSYHREMPDSLKNMIDEGLAGTTTNFMALMKRSLEEKKIKGPQAEAVEPEPDPQMSLSV